MKVFVAICLFIGLASAEYVVKTSKDLEGYRSECVKELDVPSELFDKYKKWEYPNDEKTHCYLKCIFGKFGFYTAESGINVESVHHQLAGAGAVHDDELHNKIVACVDKSTDVSACEQVYRSAMCMIKNNKELFQKSLQVKPSA